MGNWGCNPYKWSYNPTYKQLLAAHFVGSISKPKHEIKQNQQLPLLAATLQN